MEPSYTYAATVMRWVDGDTVDLRVDCGFHLVVEGRFRLHGIDTPERGQHNHDEASARAAALAPPGSSVIARTYRAPDKYGRFLAELHAGELSINSVLLEEGLARPYFGGKKAVSS